MKVRREIWVLEVSMVHLVLQEKRAVWASLVCRVILDLRERRAASDQEAGEVGEEGQGKQGCQVKLVTEGKLDQ